MNCRPGDLALVVRGHPSKNIGRVIRVTKLDDLASYIVDTPMWDYEGDLLGHLGARSCRVADECLRPIRDPGDDAVDETLIYCGDPRVREVQHG